MSIRLPYSHSSCCLSFSVRCALVFKKRVRLIAWSALQCGTLLRVFMVKAASIASTNSANELTIFFWPQLNQPKGSQLSAIESQAGSHDIITKDIHVQSRCRLQFWFGPPPQTGSFAFQLRFSYVFNTFAVDVDVVRQLVFRLPLGLIFHCF